MDNSAEARRRRGDSAGDAAIRRYAPVGDGFALPPPPPPPKGGQSKLNVLQGAAPGAAQSAANVGALSPGGVDDPERAEARKAAAERDLANGALAGFLRGAGNATRESKSF